MYNVSFKGKSCLEAGTLVIKRPSIPAPELAVEEFEIPGRDGVVLSNVRRYEPIDIKIEFNFMSKTPDDWGNRFRQFKKWATGAGDLFLSDDADWFYKVYYTTITDTERSSRRIGSADVVFRCDPYVYMKDGTREHTISECLWNPGVDCLPIYKVIGTGSYTLTINGYSFAGTSFTETDIDVEKMEARNRAGALVNTSVIGDYMKLKLNAGENSIAIDGADLLIVPRWRMI